MYKDRVVQALDVGVDKALDVGGGQGFRCWAKELTVNFRFAFHTFLHSKTHTMYCWCFESEEENK